MQDKIQEIIGLVDDIIGCDSAGYQLECKREIQSKLRELVREPLTEQEISIVFDKTEDESEYGTYDFGFFKDFTRNVERAHNITNTSGEV